jgi:predicted PurR-regulated permease PerM
MNSALPQSVVRSYAVVAGALVLAAWLHLGTLLLTVLFSFFTLRKLCFRDRRWLSVGAFVIFLFGAFFGFGLFTHQAVVELPRIVAKAVPTVVQYAGNNGINLPITDLDDLKEAAPAMVRQSLGTLGNFAKIATKEFVMLVAGVVIAIGIFVNRFPQVPSQANLYAHYESMIFSRFSAFYESFERVMGAQLIISLVNTVATSIYLLSSSMRVYAGLLIPLTFICGMLPIVGNLISNTLIIGIAFGLVSPSAALGALIFLVVIHKMEYFLNSKVIGSRIRHPMWLTLIGLILGEYLMGIPGVILAPVILSFLKLEGSRYPAC